MTKEQKNLEEQRRESKRLRRIRSRWDGNYPAIESPRYTYKTSKEREEQFRRFQASW